MGIDRNKEVVMGVKIEMKMRKTRNKRCGGGGSGFLSSGVPLLELCTDATSEVAVGRFGTGERILLESDGVDSLTNIALLCIPRASGSGYFCSIFDVKGGNVIGTGLLNRKRATTLPNGFSYQQ